MKVHFGTILSYLLLTSSRSAVANKLTLLHINDHHSHLTEQDAGYINLFDDDVPQSVQENNGGTTYIRAYYGGMPRLVTAFNTLQSQAESDGRHVLKLHAGDAITGTTYFTVFEGEADANLMTHICFDAFAPGNHEFDKGDAGLANFLRAIKNQTEGSSTCESQPAVLGANIVPHVNSPLLSSDVPEIEKSRVFVMDDGSKVGVIGIDIKRKTMESSQPDEGTILLDERETAQAEIDALTASGVNMIVLLTHIGYQNDQDWMAQLDGVDVVVGGDSHSLLGNTSTTEMFGSVRGPYATKITRSDGSLVCVVQSWEYSKVIGQLDIDFDSEGNVLSCEGHPTFALNPDRVTVRDASPRYDMNASDASTVIEYLMEKSMGQAIPFAEDEDTLTDLNQFQDEVDVLSQTVIATASEYIPLEAGGYESGACDLVSQSFILNPLSTADVAIQNRGGCRANIEEGNFTVNDAYTLLPFSNTMVNLEMTGQQIKNVLEDAIDFYLDPTGSWGAYPRASGLRFDVNEAKEKGSRVSNLEVNVKLAGSWESIDGSSYYMVVTNSFIADSRDGYYEFGNVPEEKVENTYVEYAQTFIEYAQAEGIISSVPADRASTQNWSDELGPTASPSPGPSLSLPCTSIKDIQGSGSSSPLVNERVLVCDAYVTAIVYNGIYIQESDAFGEDYSDYSSGIFVYLGNDDTSGLSVGDHLEVIGMVSEYYGNTQISSISSPLVPSSTSKRFFTPAVIALPVDDMFEFEKYEGMIVNFVSQNGDKNVFSEYYNFDRYGEVKICASHVIHGRNYQFSELNKPDSEDYQTHIDYNEKSCVTIDDNSNKQNPNPALFGGIYPINSEQSFRGGDEIMTLGLRGPLFYSYGKWRVQPMMDDDIQLNVVNPRGAPPSMPEADLKLAFSNLLNYWVTIGTDSNLRGADNEEEFERQTAKTVLALSQIKADIISVCELENLEGNGAAHDLVVRLNAHEEVSAVYDAVSIVAGYDLVGADVIKVDILYDTTKFKLIGSAMLSDADVSSEILDASTTGSIFDYSRVPLAATFESMTSEDVITVVSNHFKSKGSSGATGDDADKNDGQASWNLMRTLTSKALLEWLDSYPTGIITDNIVITGDLNAYRSEDPIETLMEGGFYSPVEEFAANQPPYTYLFDGQFGTLDYALVSNTSALTVLESAVWHCNADEPDILDYNLNYDRDPSLFNSSSPFRFSDHDPVILSMNFDANTEAFSIENKLGCLTILDIETGEIKISPCEKSNIDQKFTINDSNQIVSMKDNTQCLDMGKKNVLELNKCEKGEKFSYNIFDQTLSLDGTKKVVGVNIDKWTPEKDVKFRKKKAGDEGQVWKLVYEE